MSYVENGDDELDYGEGEIGEGGAPAAVAGAASGVPAGTASLFQPDEEMGHEDEEYDDLYDDVNIGFFQAPAEPARIGDDGDGFSMDNNEAFAQRDSFMPPSKTMVDNVSVPMKTSVVKEESKELNEQENKGMPTPWSAQDGNYRPPSVPPVNGKELEHVRPQPVISLSSKDQGDTYSNGPHQGDAVSDIKPEKSYSAATLTSGIDPASAFNQKGTNVQSSAHVVSGFSGQPVRAVSSSHVDKSGGDDIAHERARGIPSGSNRPIQRDVSPNGAENTYRQSFGNENTSKPINQQPYTGDGSTMLFVGDLHWWTTDAELEAALSDYGRVKNLKFFEERVSGKSKGYCQVEFYDPAAALACKQEMNGRKFHDRPCIVAIGNAKSIQQMGYQQEKKTQAQMQAQQDQVAARRNAGGGTGGGRGGSYQDRDSGRGYGRMGGGRAGHGQGMGKSGQSGGARGRGNYMGNKGMGGGGNSGTGMPYGQGHSGPMGGHQSAMMMHQGMMGQGYDPAYGPMGRGGAAYGGYVMPGAPFSGMVGPFPGLGPGGLPGVAPHVNPAFFGRSVAPGGMGMMSGGGMEGPHQGMWGDASLGGWGGGEEHDRRTRDGSYAEDGGGAEYGYNSEMAHEKSRNIGWDKENGDWPERHRRDERDGDWGRERYREKDRDSYRDQRDRDRDRDREDDWERERPGRTRTKSRMVEDEEDDPRQRSRDDDYGRKRRMTERDPSNI